MPLIETFSAEIKDSINQQSQAYLQDTVNREWEASFGRGSSFYGKINKGTFQTVLRYLKHSPGYTAVTNLDDEQLDVTVHPSTTDRKKTEPFNVRKTFVGRKSVISFCKEDPQVLALAKNMYKSRQIEGARSIVDLNDFGVRLNLKSEVDITEATDPSSTAKQEYNRLTEYISRKGGLYRVAKTFRYKKRYSYMTTSGFRYDLTIVKSSPSDYNLVKSNNPNHVSELRPFQRQTKNIQDINLLNQPESYEIEIEICDINLFKQWLVQHEALLNSFRPEGLEPGEEPEIHGLSDIIQPLAEELCNQINTILGILTESPIPTGLGIASQVKTTYHNLVSQGVMEMTTDSAKISESNQMLRTFKHKLELLQVTGSDNPYERLVIVRDRGPGRKFEPTKFTPNFVGPKPVSFELPHLQPGSPVVKNFNHYSITDKADGEGNLLYFDSDGMAYLINGNLQVRKTGYHSPENANTLANGEYITKNAKGDQIYQLYLYDIYIYRGQVVSNHPLMVPAPAGSNKGAVKLTEPNITEMSRLDCLNQLQRSLPTDVSEGILIRVKKFYYRGGLGYPLETTTIYQLAKDCWTPFVRGQTDYSYDGLIFTPMYEPVAYDTKDDEFDRFKGKTWSNNLKWKPPEENTIDFLVETEKTEVFRQGNVKINRETTRTTTLVADSGKTEVVPYKTLKLYVGGTITEPQNPCKPNQHSGGQGRYGKVLFSPNDPYQEGAHLANLRLTLGGTQMVGKVDGSIIEDDTIVEFACQSQTADSGFFQWVPKRTRYDKTYEYHQAKHYRQLIWTYLNHVFRKGKADAKITGTPSWKHVRYQQRPRVTFDPSSGRVNLRLTVDGFFQLIAERERKLGEGKGSEYTNQLFGFLQRMFSKLLPTPELIPVRSNYGNNTNVANSVWRSIHVPVTVNIITTGTGIPPLEVTNDVYYTIPKDSRDRSSTIHLQRFHNYVKRNVMLKPAGRFVTTGNPCNVLDLACGKGGDLQKWCDIRANIVVGVDISKDNLENVHNGACQRYRELSHRYKPTVHWFQADSSRLISETLSENPEYQRLWNLDKTPNFGSNKFPIVSLQFALHYFFGHQSNLTGLLQNVSDNLQVGGLFIGTCLDGRRLSSKLRGKKHIQGEQDGRLLWKIESHHDNSDFPDDESCLNREVQVFMSSIGKPHQEYLVNFDYLRKIVAKPPYYLEPLTPTEARRIGLPVGYRSTGEGAGTITFGDIAAGIPEAEQFQRDNVHEMSNPERELSYLNCAFVFRKTK